MSPYIWFAIVMLGVVVASLLLTGNLAATFNERAKSDLKLALEPLAAQVDGTIALEEALVTGRYHGQITMAQVVAGPGGMGRLFRTSMVEAAGGESWKAVVTRPKDASAAWERSFDGDVPPSLAAPIHTLLDGLLPFPGWFELN
ncbi:MAG TPA: hypothetical protein PK691_07995, partial [Thermomicrobiales bacterium]|nr:hypothetical protein [Thermomicrobiales bacterium]